VNPENVQTKIISLSLVRRLCAVGPGGLCHLFPDVEFPAVDAIRDTPIVVDLTEFLAFNAGWQPRQQL